MNTGGVLNPSMPSHNHLPLSNLDTVFLQGTEPNLPVFGIVAHLTRAGRFGAFGYGTKSLSRAAATEYNSRRQGLM